MPIFSKMIPSCALALASTAVLTSIMIRVCGRCGWTSEPRPDRWHSGRPAFFGGVPIWLGFVAVSLLFLPINNATVWRVMGMSALMFAVGLTDDFYHLRARQKLVLQITLATLALADGMEVRMFGNALVDSGLSLLWLVGITNSFNLLDNMDGLSPGVALITALFLAVYFLQHGNDSFCQLTFLLVGSVAGFLLFNYHPARIFMGDCGSLFLGFVLASLSLVLLESGGSALRDGFSVLILFGIPILDTVLVSLTRRLRGQAISQGGTDHISHRLVQLGLRESRAVLLIYAASAATGGVSLLTHAIPRPPGWWAGGIWALILASLAVHVFRRTEPAYRPDPAMRLTSIQEADGAD
jgi:UDP-GlcNAc:undecaprenyl-phosphate GlcNAc-1-phosphate transferase